MKSVHRLRQFIPGPSVPSDPSQAPTRSTISPGWSGGFDQTRRAPVDRPGGDSVTSPRKVFVCNRQRLPVLHISPSEDPGPYAIRRRIRIARERTAFPRSRRRAPLDRCERIVMVVGALVPMLTSFRGEGGPILIHGDASRNSQEQGGLSQANLKLLFGKKCPEQTGRLRG